MKVDSIVDRACQHIQEWIVTGRFKPGEQIKEENVSQRLEISRPPVREALKMLEATGLVVRKPRRGVFVPLLTKKDVWEIYTLKAALYELVTELALDVITDRQVRELETLVAEMERIVSDDPVDILEYQKHHNAFHSRVMEIAGNGR
ncbi:MAG: GntR family transcriptional regulator, partial [Desulfosarcina sp.]|nr:GntR family transcriptional regulator [Desulfobacterales bacterium]